MVKKALQDLEDDTGTEWKRLITREAEISLALSVNLEMQVMRRLRPSDDPLPFSGGRLKNMFACLFQAWVLCLPGGTCVVRLMRVYKAPNARLNGSLK